MVNEKGSGTKNQSNRINGGNSSQLNLNKTLKEKNNIKDYSRAWEDDRL